MQIEIDFIDFIKNGTISPIKYIYKNITIRNMK